MKVTDEPRLLPVTPDEMRAAIETVDAGNAEVEAYKAKYKEARKAAIENLDERIELQDAMLRLAKAKSYLADMCRAFAAQKGTP